MQRKRVVLILILSIGLAAFLGPPLTSSTTINQKFATISSTSQDNLSIISPSEPITWCKDL